MADTVDGAAPEAMVSVSTYTPAVAGVTSSPWQPVSISPAAVTVWAPVATTVEPEVPVCRIFRLAETPEVPTVKAHQPNRITPVMSAGALGIVIVQMVVSAASAGDATTLVDCTTRAEKSIEAALHWIGELGICA